MTHDQFREWDAAYVLGLLAPEDRRAYEEHLEDCAPCSAAVAELAGMPGILGALTPDEAVALLDREPSEASDELVARLATATRRRRRRLRLAVAGAGLAAAVGVGVAGYAVGSGDDTDTGRFIAMSEVQPGIMAADLRVEDRSWGTRFDWDCRYRYANASDPREYELVITDTAGDERVVATWYASKSDAGRLAASSSVPTSKIRRVEIRLVGDEQALTRTEL